MHKLPAHIALVKNNMSRFNANSTLYNSGNNRMMMQDTDEVSPLPTKLNKTIYKANRHLSNAVDRPSIKIEPGIKLESPNLRTRLQLAHQTLYSP
jgi:hypothetical protein